MSDCNCLIHPFQNDPGTSQRQRIMDELLTHAVKIDARTLADLLDYFVQLSRHINYYDLEMNVADWQPFFQKSTPFTLASVIKYPVQAIEDKYSLYNSLFKRRPSITGLQLNTWFFYYHFVRKINDWHLSLKDSKLPVVQKLELLIKDKLQQPVKKFIGYANAASQFYHTREIDFMPLYENKVWNLDLPDLYATDHSFQAGTKSKFKRLNTLYKSFTDLSPSCTDVIKLLATEAEKNLELSLVNEKDEQQQKHLPHLGLLFTFLKIFRNLQDDLNGYTRRHLDFFYKDILHFTSGPAVPDKTHVLFEIQKQLKNYALKKGLLVKDSKDEKKQDILFSLDDEIVVNKTEIAEKRTLFLNNQISQEQTYVEGIYMATDASKADGVDKDFQTEVVDFPTVGAKNSKYTNPATKIIKPYPNGNLGFILASPVLYLQGGTRKIIARIASELKGSICGNIGDAIMEAAKSCCHKNEPADPIAPTPLYPPLLSAKDIYTKVKNDINKKYVYISEDLFVEAIGKGFPADIIQQIREQFLAETPIYQPCYCDIKKYKPARSLYWTDWNAFVNPLITVPSQKEILDTIFKAEKIFSVSLSGEKNWIQPGPDEYTITMSLLDANDRFHITVETTLEADKPAVTFFDSVALKEDYGTLQPVLKIMLNDRLKMEFPITPKPPLADPKACCEQDAACCLLKTAPPPPQVISFYHFFRNVEIIKKVGVAPGVITDDTRIRVEVCGLRKFVVQNDESVQDVNGPIYPFGTRPDIINFGVVDGYVIYCITKEFIIDVQAGVNMVTGPTIVELQNLIVATGTYPVGSTIIDITNFVTTKITNLVDQGKIANQLQAKNYCAKNLIGPSFFIGSKEIFGKKWEQAYVNLDWKDRPTNFRDYYKGYINQKDPAAPLNTLYGLDDQQFQVNLSVLEKGNWKPEAKHPPGVPVPPFPEDTTIPNTYTTTNNRRLFPLTSQPSFCASGNVFQQRFHLQPDYFPITTGFDLDKEPDKKYDTTSRYGFLKINLQNQDFLHKDYAYVLARQMNAAAMLGILDTFNKPKKVEGAVYYDASTGGLVVFSTDKIRNDVLQSKTIADRVRDDVNVLNTGIRDLANLAGDGNPIAMGDADAIREIINPIVPIIHPLRLDLTGDVEQLKLNIHQISTNIDAGDDYQAIIPNEPWTPIISSIALDYIANATIEDIDLVHIHPFAGTYQAEEIELKPTLLPTFCDEGSLFLGLKELVPGESLNILFQLAEATADSESEKEKVNWYYLDNNYWRSLRTGFEVIDDATENLTTSGIIKFSLPENMTKKNTVMPKDLYWIKAAIPKNSKAVSETTGIHPQAMRVTFTNDEANDKLRLAKPLPKGSVSRLNTADAAVRSVQQPYDSFDGQVPEGEGHFYVRVSETLRHKGRAIQPWDYERIALEAFPQLYKVKCLSHSFGLDAHKYANDFPYAPGYVLLAVIPDLYKLKAGNSFEPKAPVSILEKVDEFMRKRTSPFVRFRTMNPRYEKINFCIRVQLFKGKDENYYKDKLAEDLREFLAPWAVGEYHKLTFGQCIYRSDITRFLETRDYVDFITDLRMGKESVTPMSALSVVCPDTPRSILVAGDIEVCIEKRKCDKWGTYIDCEKVEITTCDNVPEPLIDYCKVPKKKKQKK